MGSWKQDKGYWKKHISQASDQIGKITSAMLANIDDYKKAVDAGNEKEIEKYKKRAKDLGTSKRNWEKHMEELLLNLDKNVELHLDETKLMKKSYLQQIIKEEYQKLITEKFGSPKFAELKKRLGNWDGNKFFSRTAKAHGIQWNNVNDTVFGNAANTSPGILNFMFVGSILKGVFLGKKFVDFFSKPLEKRRKGDAMGNVYDVNYRQYYTSYKKVLKDATEILTIDLNMAKQQSTAMVAGREAARQGATALMKARDIARSNNTRYQELLRQKRDIAGFGVDEVEKLIAEATKILEAAIGKHAATLKSGMYPQDHWGTEYSKATRLLNDIMDLYTRYLEAGQAEAKAHAKQLSGEEVEGGDSQWYIDWAVKDAKKHVSDMRSKLKDYYLTMKKIEKAPVRAIGAY